MQCLTSTSFSILEYLGLILWPKLEIHRHSTEHLRDPHHRFLVTPTISCMVVICHTSPKPCPGLMAHLAHREIKPSGDRGSDGWDT